MLGSKCSWFLVKSSWLVILLGILTVVLGNMVPISDVKDHPVSSTTPSKSSSTEQPYKSAEDQAKVKHVHGQIAQEFLKRNPSKESNIDKVEEDKGHRVTRQDKPMEFQNPAKHASEEVLLHFLLEQYKLSGDNEEQKLEILENLEHFSHKYENGRDLFSSTDALETIFLPALNSSSVEIRKLVCGIFAIAAQNNPIVQSKSVNSGVIRYLLQLISSDKEVRSKALFALSSLLRNFPDAQKKFIQDGGIIQIIKLGYFPETRRRSITFLTDLINERKLCNQNGSLRKSDDHAELVSEDPCDQMNLLTSSLVNGGWCDLLATSIKGIYSFGLDDQILIIEAVHASLSSCHQELHPFHVHMLQLLEQFQKDPDLDPLTLLLKEIVIATASPHVAKLKTEL